MNNGAVFSLPTITASNEEIPQSILSSSAPGVIPSKVIIRSINNAYGQCGPNSQMHFPIPCGPNSGFLKSGSAYIYASLTGTTSAATPTISFNHSLDSNALVSRMLLYWSGTIADTCLGYNRNLKMLDANVSNSTYNINDLAVMTFKNQVKLVANSTFTIDFCIPVRLSAFIGQQDLPIYLCTNNLVLEVGTDTIASSFLVSSGDITNYTMSNIRLVYETFNTSLDYENSLRSVLQQGKFFSIPLYSWYNGFINNSVGLKTIPINICANSVLGIFWYCETDAGTVLTQHKMTSDGMSNPGLRVFIDGQLQTPFDLSPTPISFCESRRAFGTLESAERSSSYVSTFTPVVVENVVTSASIVTVPLTPALYRTDQFTSGFSLIKTNESGLTMKGTSVNSQLQIEVTNSGVAGGNLYYFVCYEQVMAIDASGLVQMIRY